MFFRKKIIIAGGSGFIGQAMAARWSKQNDVIILSRGISTANNTYRAAPHSTEATYLHWDGKCTGAWTASLEHADVLINLSGRSVNCRYNPENKAAIFSSRLESTAILGEAMAGCIDPPKLWINGASATIYPNATDTSRDESFTEFADDFSVQVCKAWEQAFNRIELRQTRKIILRMAIVLGHGGVLIPFKRLAKLLLGGAQGNGMQMFSWIHIDDLCRIIEWMDERTAAQGVYNASSPQPIRNHAFMKAIRETLHVPFGVPAPEWMLKMGAKLIGTETELLLKSRWVVPGRLLQEGYKFRYPDVKKALDNLLNTAIEDLHHSANT